MSARIMNALARLAQGKMLGPLFTTCETQQQVSTQKLERYLETVGDQLKDCAFEIRTDYDALAADNARLLADNEALYRGLKGKHATTGATYEHLAAERDALRAELAALKAQQVGQEPVAWLSLDGRSAYTDDDLDTITANYRATLRPLYTTPQPAPAQDVAGLYTCEGKGGEYARIGTSLGAGECRGEIVEVYRDTSSGQLYHRESADFFVRMKPVSHDKQSGGEV